MMGTLPPPFPDTLLSVRDLVVDFAGMRAVDGISFDIAAGETLCIVGESGCGKSTVVQALLRLIDGPEVTISSSAMSFAGEDLQSMPDEALRQVRGNQIAMVFQDATASLHPMIRVGDQVAEVLRTHLGMTRSAARVRTIELLRQFGISAPELRYRAYPHQLSGGMCQRIMIAMAVACGPRLLLADEPTTALDVTVQAQIVALLQAATISSGMAMIFISHDLGVVAGIADRVAVMYAGTIVETGPVDLIYSRPVHPYTKALLRSMPSVDANTDQRLSVIPGTVEGSHGSQGCPFAPRCDVAVSRCPNERPPSIETGRGHFTACWRAEELAA
jgi:oligopeptide/dipeptide ABC transporter ATP-binding protein